MFASHDNVAPSEAASGEPGEATDGKPGKAARRVGVRARLVMRVMARLLTQLVRLVHGWCVDGTLSMRVRG